MDEEEPDLAYEVRALSAPFVKQVGTAAIHFDHPGTNPQHEVIDRLVLQAVAELRAVLADYGIPDAAIEVSRAQEDLPGHEPSRLTSVVVRADESTCDLLNDHMNERMAPSYRRQLDAAGRDLARVSTWFDGLVRWF